MVVTCLLGMRIPVGPVSERNPALSLMWSRNTSTSTPDSAEPCSAGQPRAAVPTCS